MPPTEAGTLRLGQILGCAVVAAGGEPLGVVTDLRLAQVGPVRGALAELQVEALLVSTRRAGSMLGYDRRRQGPLLVGVLVRRLHRHARLVRWDDVADLDLEGRRLRIKAGAGTAPATAAR